LPVRFKKQQQEKRREKLVFALFVFLSLVFHGVILIAFAANVPVRSPGGEMMDAGNTIQVEPVIIPPTPPDPPPSLAAEPPPSALPEPVTPKPPAPPNEAAPVATPVPSARPTPQPLPSPTPQRSVEPGELESFPEELPEPELTPSPATPDQIADLPPSEQAAKDVVSKLLEEQGLEKPTELPFGFNSWEEYEKMMVGYEDEARRLGVLPSNTQGSENTNPNLPSSDPNLDPNAQPGDANTPRSGFRYDNLETNHNPFHRPSRAETELDENIRRLRDLANLPVPTPTPIPLPDYTTGDLGAFLNVTFSYDNLTFRVRWETALSSEKKVTAQYYPRNQPSQIQTLELPWREEWAQNTPALVQAVLQAYEAQKSGASR